LAAWIAPCSVKANGSDLENFSFWRWSQLVTTSAFSAAESWNMKSIGNRSALRLTAWFSALVGTTITLCSRTMTMRFSMRGSITAASAADGVFTPALT
jgi:hypothetical protein